MESESSASKAKRRARSFQRHGTEFVLAAAFVGAVYIGGRITQTEGTGPVLKVAAVALPLVVLTGWWAFYALLINSLDEFERAMATRSLAISCGATLWITTAWGLAVAFVGAPALSLAMVAPLAVVIYSLVRVFFVFYYR